MLRNLSFVALTCAFACSGAPPEPATTVPASAKTPDAVGLAELTRLDLLPRFKRSVRVGSFSS